MCEPSPQRSPVLFQAGQSGRGIDFAARHAEAVFALYADLDATREGAEKTRAAVATEGRAPENVKIFPGITVVVADSDAEAREKFESYRQYASPEGALALFSGWAGYDFAELPSGVALADVESDAIQGLLGYFKQVDPDRDWTLEEMGDHLSLASVMPQFIGSPQTVADQMEYWMEEADIDGFNLAPVVQPTGFEEFVDLVVPELQKRGRIPTGYGGATLREHYFGAGRTRLPDEHIALRSLPEWKRS
jgi:alkanesulfonate monooxygenase SsuD/methylene tetrahydromethanopterin reductase-like flavin-dependent oxidoreductase (luciferase family)